MKELKARKFAPFPKEKEERIRTLEKAHAEVVEKIKASEAEEAQRRNKEERGFVYFSRGNAGADKARELSAEDGRRVADALSGFIEGVNVEVLDDAAFEARLREAEGGNAFAGSEYDGEAEIEVVNIDSPLNSDEQKDTSRIKNEILKPLIGSEVEIRSDGRIVFFERSGLESALKKRRIHRSVLKSIREVISGSRYFDYRESDGQEKHKNVLGQFIYAVPVNIGGKIYRCEILIDRKDTSEKGSGSFKQQSVFRIADTKVTEVALSGGYYSAQGGSTPHGEATASVTRMKMRELMGEVNPKNVRVPFQRIFGDEQEIGSSKELRDVSGKVYGWYEPKTKRVVLRAGARMDTALHEILGHATFDWARGNAPELYAKMREYAAGAPEEVKAAIRDAYPDVAEGSAAWEDEVFAHLIAADNEDLIRSRVLGEAGVSWLVKVRAWFGRLWRRFVRALGGSASEDLDVRAIAGMDAKAGMRRLVESALAGKRLGTWSAEARERGNAVSPERERFYSRAAEGTRRARAETASKLNEELEAWKNRYAELLSFGGMALSADARDANYERARLERAKGAESRRRAQHRGTEKQRESCVQERDAEVGTYAWENPYIRYSVLRKRGKWDNWRVVDMQELVELNSNYGTLRDSKRKIFYFSVGSERAYLIRKSDSFSAPFDILAVCDINLPQDEFESKYASALRAVSESSSTSVDSLVEQVRSIIGNDGSDVGGFEATRGGEGVLQSSAGSLRQDGESSGARSSDGDACFDGNGKLVAYRIGGKYVDERVRVRFRRASVVKIRVRGFRRATAGGRPPFRSRGVPVLCGRKRVSGRAWRRCGAGRAPFLPGRRRR